MVGRSEREVLQFLSDGIFELDKAKVVDFANMAVAMKIDAYTAIQEGLSAGMTRVSRKFDEREYFVPELILAADAMNAGVDILRPHMKPLTEEEGATGRFVIGTVKGDIHRIGKNIVCMMLQNAGFEVFNLGENVPHRRFVETVIEKDAHILGMSALMTTTMLHMQNVIRETEKVGIRDKIRIVIGGAPVGEAFKEEIGADYYAVDAAAGVRIAQAIMREIRGKKAVTA